MSDAVKTKKPKAPQDHKAKKPKIEDLEGGDKRVTFPDGFSVVVYVAMLNDFELLDMLSRVDEKDPKFAGEVPALLRRAVGDQFGLVMDHIRDEQTGRVSVEAGVQFFYQLFGALNPNS